MRREEEKKVLAPSVLFFGWSPLGVRLWRSCCVGVVAMEVAGRGERGRVERERERSREREGVREPRWWKWREPTVFFLSSECSASAAVAMEDGRRGSGWKR